MGELIALKPHLQRDELQTGNAFKVAHVTGADSVTKFQRTGTDQEISQRKIDAVGSLFTTNAGDDFRRRFSERIDGNGRL